MFLSHPSVKDEPDLEGRTAFMWAAGKGSDEVIRTMLGLTPQIDINMADKYGGTGEKRGCSEPEGWSWDLNTLDKNVSIILHVMPVCSLSFNARSPRSASCSVLVGPREHREAAAGEGSHGGLPGCDEAHAAVPCLRDGAKGRHPHPH